MSKIALVFAGQGSQYTGMGKEICDSSVLASNVFSTADSIREGTSNQCFNGTKEELSLTINTQPCLFAVDLACAMAVVEKKIKVDGVAGFSLGEIPALAFSGVLSSEDAFKLVCKRGEFMNECASERKGAMAAVLKLPFDVVEEICNSEDELYPVNYNCPGQLVVAGSPEAIEKLGAKVSEKKGKCVPLAVSGAFHSPFMNKASDKMAELLGEFNLKAPIMPIYANKTAKPYEGEYKELISAQVKNPVKWTETIENMIADGFDTFIEVGAGKTLSGLIKKINKEVKVFNVENLETLEKLTKELN